MSDTPAIPALLKAVARRLISIINADTPTPPKAVGAAVHRCGTYGAGGSGGPEGSEAAMYGCAGGNAGCYCWSPPPATDDQFRAAGYTAKARGFPLSEAGARWVAAWNGIEFEKIPASWCYAPNGFMQQWVEEKADGKS